MNFHSDEWIMNKVKEHYDEALQYFKEEQIVGVFLQGSQNYGLDYEGYYRNVPYVFNWETK